MKRLMFIVISSWIATCVFLIFGLTAFDPKIIDFEPMFGPIMVSAGVASLISALWSTLGRKERKINIIQIILLSIVIVLGVVAVSVSLAKQFNFPQSSNPIINTVYAIIPTIIYIINLVFGIQLLKDTNVSYRIEEPLKIKPIKEWFYFKKLNTLPFLIGGLFSGLAIFSMFAAPMTVSFYGHTKDITYSMFRAAVGGVTDLGGEILARSFGYILIFILCVFASALCIVYDFIKEKEINLKFRIFNGFRAGIALLTLILALCSTKFATDSILKMEGASLDYFKLGPGPIIVLVFNAVALVSYIVGLFLIKSVPNSIKKPVKSVVNKQGSKRDINEFDNVELLTKYKKLLDDGVITKKEFEAKKKQLLK